MRTNERAKQLIADFEGCRLQTYFCPAGIPTISVGVTGPHVKVGMKITQVQADRMFDEALKEREPQLDKLLGDAPTTPDEYGAMMSLLYNIGEAKFAKSSVLRFHKAGDRSGAARAFSLWNKAKVKGVLVPLKGLTRRRAEEARLYLGEL